VLADFGCERWKIVRQSEEFFSELRQLDKFKNLEKVGIKMARQCDLK
jgi:hypothetical protein